MSDYQKSSSDLIEKINKFIEADGQTFLSSKVCEFINNEYTKEKEKLIYDASMKVEEVNFHNLTTVYNLEKLWDILHEQHVVKRGRPLKESPIDVEVLKALESSTNGIITGFEPAPTPDFIINGYRIPDHITFEGVKKGRKPSALKNYSFIESYNASKLDPMGSIESNDVNNVEVSTNDVKKTDNKSVNEIMKHAANLKSNDNKCSNVYYSIDMLKKKQVEIKQENNVKNVTAPNIPKLVASMIPVKPIARYEPSYMMKRFMDPISYSYKPVPVSKVVSPLITNVVFPPSKLPVKLGRPIGSKNKTAEEKEEIERNKLPKGRPLGSLNKGPTKQSDKDVIIKNDEIMLRVNPNQFEIHMIQYTLANVDKCYSEWINHAEKITEKINEDNKHLSKEYLKDWDRLTLNGISRICSKLTSDGSHGFNPFKMNSVKNNHDDINRILKLQSDKYIDTVSGNIDITADEVRELLDGFKDNERMSSLLVKALKNVSYSVRKEKINNPVDNLVEDNVLIDNKISSTNNSYVDDLIDLSDDVNILSVVRNNDIVNSYTNDLMNINFESFNEYNNITTYDNNTLLDTDNEYEYDYDYDYDTNVVGKLSDSSDSGFCSDSNADTDSDINSNLDVSHKYIDTDSDSGNSSDADNFNHINNNLSMFNQIISNNLLQNNGVIMDEGQINKISLDIYNYVSVILDKNNNVGECTAAYENKRNNYLHESMNKRKYRKQKNNHSMW